MKATEPITAKAIETHPEGLVLILSEKRIQIPWEDCSRKLAEATESQRLNAELSPGGYGIHWPELDEDLSVNGLVRDFGSA